MGGGDLLSLLIERDVLEEDFAYFYITEVCVFFLLPEAPLYHRFFYTCVYHHTNVSGY
jgi:hypothetical protein